MLGRFLENRDMGVGFGSGGRNRSYLSEKFSLTWLGQVWAPVSLGRKSFGLGRPNF